ncbi:MAG: hypothetical protein ACR2PO_14025 [Methyloligellaceae bacterium]
MNLTDPLYESSSVDKQEQAEAIARAERSLSVLEATFRHKARAAADEVCRMLATIELDGQNHLGVENHARLAQTAELASDIAAQLSFFGTGPVSDLAGRISHRLDRRDGWDADALETVVRQAAELRVALGTGTVDSDAAPASSDHLGHSESST